MVIMTIVTNGNNTTLMMNVNIKNSRVYDNSNNNNNKHNSNDYNYNQAFHLLHGHARIWTHPFT